MLDLNAVGQRSDQMKVFTLVGRKGFLHRQRIVSTSLVEFLETLQPVQRARMFVADARQLRFGVGNSFVTLDDGFDRGFTFGRQAAIVSRAPS